MKPLRAALSLLLCVVLLESQALAATSRSGGGGATVQVIGTYAGVLLPDAGEVDADTGDTSNNTLGIFSLTVPETGLSSGGFLVFANGQTFTGTINAFADPDLGRILGVLQATFDFSIPVATTGTTGVNTVTEVDITASATGRLLASVSEPTLGTASLGRLVGTAQLDVNFGQIDPNDFSPIIVNSLNFIVDGFKQSLTPIPTATNFGTTGGTGGNTGT